jgi:protein TilB
MHEEMEQQKLEQEKRKNPDAFKPPKPLSSEMNLKGDRRQCNEGKYLFNMREWDDPDYSFFELKISKYIDTSEIVAQVYPNFVSVRVLTKLTQLRLFEEVIPEGSKIQRSEITGDLIMTMRKKDSDEMLRALALADKAKKLKELEKVIYIFFIRWEFGEFAKFG